MSRLIRMDHTGHTTLAEWTADDPEAVDAAVRAVRAELVQGSFGEVYTGDGHAEQVRQLPGDADLRRLIGGRCPRRSRSCPSGRRCTGARSWTSGA